MGLSLRRAHIESDRDLLVDAFRRYINPHYDAPRFDWLYKSNPHGEARAWIAYDQDTKLVGAAGAFPRRMYVGDREQLGWVLGDFCVNPQYRSLGPALQLQRTFLKQVDSGEMAFWYDFPSSSMMALYRRLRIEPFARLVRLAKPLRVDSKVKRFVDLPLVTPGLTKAGNMALRLFSTGSRPGQFEIAGEEGPWGEEFTRLAQAVGGGYGICIQRSAEYLNWRYFANPFRTYEMITARHNGSLIAYAVLTSTERSAVIGDLFGLDRPEALEEIVRAAVELSGTRAIEAVSLPILSSHLWMDPLRRLGFTPREAGPVVFYGKTSISAPADDSRRRWFLLDGDRDS